MHDIGIVLLALHAVLAENTAFQRDGGCCPVIAGHRVGERDDQVELSDVHQTAVGLAQGLLRGIVHRDARRVGDVAETPADRFSAQTVVGLYFTLLAPFDARNAFEYGGAFLDSQSRTG